MAITDPTPNYSWDLPTDQGDDGTWGAMLREILGNTTTGIDAVLFAVSTVANAALARAGGTMTGALKLLTEHFTTSDLGSMTGAVAMNLAAADVFYGTATGTITFSFSNVPASGNGVFWTLEITNGGSQTINWPASVSWPGGSPPDLTSSGVDLITFYTRDGGTNVYAMVAGLNIS
ncbi:MAG: hypothetical protein AB7R40_23355 [Nitrospiraceae bacterium]